MTAQITRQAHNSITIEVTLPLTGSMLRAEEAIQDALNEVGLLATEKNLERFDTDGSPIQLGSVRMTSKGQFAQDYETPYGSVSVLRHVYQTSEGGKTFCPLEESARLVLNATPRFAKLVSYKYAEAGADAVVADLLECQHRKISKRYVKSLGDIVGAYAVAKEETWSYALPQFEHPCASIAIGVDGTCMLLQEDGWRVAMTGTIAFYDAQGERLHTIYAGATPEYGKEKFHAKFQREVERVKNAYPNVPYIGLGDGAADNWSYLRGLRDQSAAVELRFRDGNSMWFPYSWLGNWQYNPSHGLLLKFSGDLVYLVLIRGSNIDRPLNEGAINLTHAGLQRHRVLWVREMSADEIRQVGETGPTIDSIEVAEFEKHSDLKEWLGKHAPEFAR